MQFFLYMLTEMHQVSSARMVRFQFDRTYYFIEILVKIV